MEVAVGVIRDGDRVLLARRPDHVHQGGRWEFPGGKREPGEDRQAALARELEEELGIRVMAARPLITVCHHYPDKTVRLDVWVIARYAGTPHGREGQEVRWTPIDALPELDFPAANRPIVQAVRLPDRYLVTGAFRDERDCLARLERALERSVRLIQLRAHHLDRPAFTRLARQAATLCHEAGARLLINAPPEWVDETNADGVHLTGRRLMALSARPLPEGRLVAASVHDAEQIAQANRIGADFSVLSPVQPTASHPEARPLGWAGFARLVAEARHPVYALGGMQERDRERAWAAGGQGIAAIGALWS